jgi:2-haloacid dehalogenase
VNPKNALFIDDNKRNIEGGLALGLPGIHFQSPEQLKTELIKAGVIN